MNNLRLWKLYRKKRKKKNSKSYQFQRDCIKLVKVSVSEIRWIYLLKKSKAKMILIQTMEAMINQLFLKLMKMMKGLNYLLVEKVLLIKESLLLFFSHRLDFPSGLINVKFFKVRKWKTFMINNKSKSKKPRIYFCNGMLTVKAHWVLKK